MLTPKYKQNIIVGIKKDYKFRWYILPITIAILNLNKLKPSTKNYYMSHTSFAGIRQDCQSLNSKTEIDEYIKAIKTFWISSEQLSNLLAHASKSGKHDFASDFCPSLYYNFDDNKIFYSSDDFLTHIECIPDMWQAVKSNFLESIPSKHQFWKLI